MTDPGFYLKVYGQDGGSIQEVLDRNDVMMGQEERA